jgi:hypothetical protein
MSINRFVVVLPVLAGLTVTGSAVAHMLPRESVRDAVYQTCAHNGVHFNKQGHPNCGLHLGWSKGSGDQQGDEPGTTESEATEPGVTDGTAGSDSGHGHGHQNKGKGHGHAAHGQAAHDHAGHASHGHKRASHGSASHGHAGHAAKHGHSKG